MFQANRLVSIGILSLALFAAQGNAQTPPRGVVAGFAVAQALLDIVAAPFAFYSKAELSPVAGEPRRASMEGATVAYAVGAAFSVASIPALFKNPAVATGLLGFALTSEAVGAGLTASTFGSDQDPPSHPYLVGSFTFGTLGLLAHSITFIGSIVAEERASALTARGLNHI